MWVKIPVNMTIAIISYDVMIIIHLTTVTGRNAIGINQIWLISRTQGGVTF